MADLMPYDLMRAGVPIPKGVLRRKFDCPPAPAGYGLAGRRKEVLDDLGAWRVCLVSAACGYGKTAYLSKLCEWFSQRGGCVPLWVSLDDRDADPIRFVSVLGYCLAALDKRFGELATGGVDSYEDMLVDMINLLDELLPRAQSASLLVFLDDYDAASCPVVDDIVLFFNKNAPANVHLVLAARSFRRQIDDLLLDGSVVEIGNDELVMDEEELELFAYRVVEGLDANEYAELSRTFGSWPLGYQFRAMAAQRSSSRPEMRVSLASYCERYFSANVMNGLDARIQEFLIESSLLDELYPAVCAAVTGEGDSASVLRYLERANCFCSYDIGKGCYRIDPAFRRFLTDKLLSLSASQLASLAFKASAAYGELGHDDLAAKYLVMTCDPLYLLGSVESSTNIDTSLAGEEPLSFFLNRPAPEYMSDPLLIWCVIWAKVSAGLVDDMPCWLDTLAAAAPDAENARAIEYARAICLALEGDSAGSLALIGGIGDREGSELPRAFQCLLIHMKGEDSERMGDLRGSRELYLKGLSLAERSSTRFYKAFDLYLLAHQHYLLGEFDEALSYAHKGLSIVKDSSAICGEFNSIIASVFIERAELDEGEKWLKRALSRVSLQTNIDMYVDTHLALTRFHMAKGDFAEALETVVDLLDNVEGRVVPRNLDVSARALGVRIALASGDPTRAYSWKAALESYAGNPDALRAVPCLLSLMALAAYEGDVGRACQLAQAAEDRLANVGGRYMPATLALLKASLFVDMGRESEANVAMTKSLELSMRGGYLMMYCTGSPQAYQVVLGIASRQKGSAMLKAHAKRVLGVMSPPVDSVGNAMASSDEVGFWSLTEREREVMELLNQGLSRNEIAQAQSVSQNTVKTHLKNIYAKLGVHSRSEVLRIAQEHDD